MAAETGSNKVFRNEEEGSKTVAAITQFSWTLYRHLSQKNMNDNVFLSPASIAVALTMTYLGARGNTKEEMKQVMNFDPISEDQIHAAFEDLLGALTDTGGKYTLHTANKLYGRQDMEILEDFLQATQMHYKAGLEKVNFAGDPEGSAEVINKWVESQTNSKIKDLIKSEDINPLTALILVNAIYFKGEWAEKLNPSHTQTQDFYKAKDVKVKCQMMFAQRKFNFGWNGKLQTQLVELPYVDNKLSLVVLLPQVYAGLQKLEESLTLDDLLKLEKTFQIHQEPIQMSLPRFNIEDTIKLNDTLTEMGMKDLFDEKKANLSGISGCNNLFVSKAVHKSFLEVNEEGSEAAAATAIIKQTRMMPVEFRANHPFLFFIRDNTTKAILFMGKLLDPSSGADA